MNLKKEIYLLIGHILGMNKSFEVAITNEEDSNMLVSYKGKVFMLSIVELPEPRDEKYENPKFSEHFKGIVDRYMS